jgi:hypothetical protein
LWGEAGVALRNSGGLDLDLSALVIERHADEFAGLGRRLFGRTEVEMVSRICRIATLSVM